MPLFFIFMLAFFLQKTEPVTVQSVSKMISGKFGYDKQQSFLLVNIEKQEMYLIKKEVIEKTYRISSAKNGTGNKSGSGKTPLGVHRVSEKFGAGATTGAIFVARQNTGKIAEIIREPVDVPEDHVTSRILWLEGMDPGVNKGKGIDSKARYIYIHGTPEEGLLGTPVSHGCIRLSNNDVIELFDKIQKGTLVMIAEKVSR